MTTTSRPVLIGGTVVRAVDPETVIVHQQLLPDHAPDTSTEILGGTIRHMLADLIMAGYGLDVLGRLEWYCVPGRLVCADHLVPLENMYGRPARCRQCLAEGHH